MMRSLYAGVSGLKNHQTRMDVVGNNISNVNSIGFKAGRVNFHDMLSQNISGSSRPTESLGGINPKQVGLGMSIASIDTLHTQGNLQTTGVVTDLAVQGSGFFILTEGENSFYTRAGAFGLDADGILVNPATGMRVQGWQATETEGVSLVNTASDIGDLSIPVGSKDPARATTEVQFSCNLDKRTPLLPDNPSAREVIESSWATNKIIYDSFGNAHNLSISFQRIPGTENQWQVTTVVDPESEEGTNTIVDIGDENSASNLFTVEFNNQGQLLQAIDSEGDIVDVGDLIVNLSFDVVGTTPDEEGVLERQTVAINLGEVGNMANSLTQQAAESSSKIFEQDGYAMGYMSGFQINDRGEIWTVYTNGTQRLTGQVGMATFTNPGGLEKAGSTAFTESINSGQARIQPSGIAGTGKIASGMLEMSNVDLAEQFTDMIVTQRGFQANSKTIQTSDSMLQELLTLKR